MRNKQNERSKQQTGKQAMSLVVFLVRCNSWSHCVRPKRTSGQIKQTNATTKQTERKQASDHARQHKLIDFTCRNQPAPHISKSLPRAFGSGCLAWPTSSRGCVFELKLLKDKMIVDLAISKIYGGSGWVGWPYMFMTLGS